MLGIGSRGYRVTRVRQEKDNGRASWEAVGSDVNYRILVEDLCECGKFGPRYEGG